MRILIFISALVFGSNRWAKPLSFLANGRFEEALTLVEKMPENGKTSYWKGQIYFQMQEYNRAKKDFLRAHEFGYVKKDLFYTLGQCYYATQNYRLARKYFKKSLPHFNKGASLYYLGHMSQLEEKYAQAKGYYKQIMSLSRDPQKVKKAGLYQMAEMEMAKVENHKNVRKLFATKVFKKYKVAYNYERKSPLSAEIRERILFLREKYQLDGKITLANGRKYPKRPWSLSLKLGSSYDSNVVNEGDESQAKATEKASSLMNLSASASYRKIYFNKWVVLGSFLGNFNYHNERSTSDITRNDNASTNLALENSLEHKLNGNMAKFTLNLSYIYQYRDDERKEKLTYYDDTIVLSLGEKIYFWGQDTTFKFKYKVKSHYIVSQESKTQGVSLSRNFNFFVMSTYSLSYDIIRYTDESLDTNSFNINWTFLPSRSGSIQWIPGINIGVSNPINQQESRGTEISYSPSLVVDYKLKKSKVQLMTSYLKNTSKDKENYAYTKWILGGKWIKAF